MTVLLSRTRRRLLANGTTRTHHIIRLFARSRYSRVRVHSSPFVHSRYSRIRAIASSRLGLRNGLTFFTRRLVVPYSRPLPRARSRERRERSRSTSPRRRRRATSSPSRATIESMSPASVSGRVDAIVPFAPISGDNARESDLATTTNDGMDAEMMETSDARRSRSNARERGRGVAMGRDGEAARDETRRTPRNASRRKRDRPRASDPGEGSLFWLVEVRGCSCERARACSGWRR